MILQHTYYKLASQDDYPGQPNDTPIYTPSGQLIATVPGRFAFDLSLEGSGKLSDGRVVNYSSSGGDCQTPPGYQGVRSCYRVLDPSQYPWGAGHGVPVEPLRSIAVDPSYIPWNSTVYIREFDGLQIPSIGGVGGFTHDGLFRAEDSGGGIRGNHIDIYAGPDAMYRWLDATIPTSYPNGPGLHAEFSNAIVPRGSGGSSAVLIALVLAGMAGAAIWYMQKLPKARNNPYNQKDLDDIFQELEGLASSNANVTSREQGFKGEYVDLDPMWGRWFIASFDEYLTYASSERDSRDYRYFLPEPLSESEANLLRKRFEERYSNLFPKPVAKPKPKRRTRTR